ncbi:hypothetical protein D3C79_286670 [compost metagenome]
MSEFKEFCKKILPFVQAGADGDVIQWNSGQCGWLDCNDAKSYYHSFGAKTEFRIKPRTIKIGDFDVPEPMRIIPHDGQEVYVVTPQVIDGFGPALWLGCGWQYTALERGLVHVTAKNAQSHAEALFSFSVKK